MKIKKVLYITGMFLMFVISTPMNTVAESYKSAEQILEYAAKLDNSGENERAIKMYQTIIDRYPDSKQARMAKSRLGLLQGKVDEEKDATKQRLAEYERKKSEQESAQRKANACNHLYQGIKVSYQFVKKGLWGYETYDSDAIVIGVGQSRATIKIVKGYNSGEVLEVFCNEI